METQLSAYRQDVDNGILVYFNDKPPKDIPECDKIKILYVKAGYGRELWIHEEEALTLISGLSAGVVEIMKRKPIRQNLIKQGKKYHTNPR